MPYGTVSNLGTLEKMLESMARVAGGARDALTRYTRPLTGAYYFVPSTERLRQLADWDRGDI